MITHKLLYPAFLIILTLQGLVSFWQEYRNQATGICPDPGRDTIDVVHYTINLEIPDIESGMIKGNADLQIVLKKDDLDTIILDFLGLIVDSIWLDENKLHSYHYDGRWIKLSLSGDFNQGTSILVSVFYHGKPVKDPYWGGFYFSGNTAWNMGVGMGSVPPNFGRAWYPCVDNFTDRATYDYLITVEKHLTAVCSGTLQQIFINDNGTRTYHWSLKQEIPTYLSSVAVSEYTKIADTMEGIRRPIPYSIFVKPADSLNGVKSFRNLEKYLHVFENLFGPYMWDRIGFVSVPFRGGAMEHATNIAVNNRSVNGTLDSEIMFVHEMAHNWFGNLVTCRTAGDMWLNEGWASYCEALYLEQEYGIERFKNYVRKNHCNVLRITHIRDNGYHPVYGIPHHLTYGSTVYDKGSDVAHTLRGYLGDEKFFHALKEYFRVYRFRDISTEEFKVFLSRVTETDLSDFFNSWVFSCGFPHFSVDSFLVAESKAGYNVKVFLRQKLKGTDDFSYSNKVEIAFLNDEWRYQTSVAHFSGKSSERSFFVPFKPTMVLVDPEEKISDATTDRYIVIHEPGEYDFEGTWCKVHVQELRDSVFLRVVHNWVPPDQNQEQDSHIIIPGSRYWSIEGICSEPFDASASFYYNTGKSFRNGWLDPELNDSADSLAIFFREGSSDRWKRCDYTRTGNIESGEFTVATLLKGQYALGY